MIARSNDPSIPFTPESRAVDGAVRSAAWHIIPLLAVGYIVSYIDRANISFAALTMNKDLGLTATQFGFIAGTFYVGYCLFEIPSECCAAAFWREALARPNHGLLGTRGGWYLSRAGPNESGGVPLPHWRVRGRLLPGRHVLPLCVVSRRGSGASIRLVQHRQSDVFRDQWSVVNFATRTERSSGARRVALAATVRRASGPEPVNEFETPGV